MKLLLVEDEDAIAEPLAEGLRREGFVVERVATGQEALAAAEPDFVGNVVAVDMLRAVLAEPPVQISGL